MIAIARIKQLIQTPNAWGYILSIVMHVGILLFMVFSVSTTKKSSVAQYAEKVDIVKAKAVNESAIQAYKQKILDKEREQAKKKQKEKQKLAKLKRQAKAEAKRIKELKKQQAEEKKRAQALAKKTKAIALKKKKEQDARKKALAEQKRIDDLAEKKRKEKSRIAAEQAKEQQKNLEQQRLASENRLKTQLAKEQALKDRLAKEAGIEAKRLAKQRATTLLEKYKALITRKVNTVRTIAPDFTRDLVTRVNVRLSTQGQVLSVRILRSSGNVRYDRSVETAIYQASPLPIPSVEKDPLVNKEFTNLNLNFGLSGL